MKKYNWFLYLGKSFFVSVIKMFAFEGFEDDVSILEKLFSIILSIAYDTIFQVL